MYEGYTKDAREGGFYVRPQQSVIVRDKKRRGAAGTVAAHCWASAANEAELADSTCENAGSGVVPFSSSFFAGRLLNCLHHDVKSRRDEAGSGVANGAGWGSPLRTRGVLGLVWVPAGAMAGGGVESVAAPRV